jgi:Holliday junction resolvase RusA-like endonuclease
MSIDPASVVATDTLLAFTIAGKPFPQSRPRVARSGGVYYSKTSKRERKRLREAMLDMCMERGLGMMGGPLVLVLTYRMPFPSDFLKAQRDNPPHHDRRPDCDNLAKMMMDAATEILWDDDAQIVLLQVSKRYDANPGIVVQVTKMKEMR